MLNLRSIPEKHRGLVAHILADCDRAGVTVRFESAARVGGVKQSCVGYFEHTDRLIVVARRDSFWVQTLAHEYCHMQQWLDGAHWFCDPKIDACWSVYDEWLAGKNGASDTRIQECARHIQQCELDAERRTYRLLKTWRLEREISNYIEKSNVYVLSYEAARRLRKWHNRRHPTLIPEFVQIVPQNRFVRRNRVSALPRGFLDLYRDRCI